MSRTYNERKHYTDKWVARRVQLVKQSVFWDYEYQYSAKRLGVFRNQSPWSCIPNCPGCMSPRHNKTVSGKKEKLTMQELRSDITYAEGIEEADF